MELRERLESIDCDSVDRFSFAGVDTFAKIANIYDPDTFTIVFECNSQLIKLNVRLNGIDAQSVNQTFQRKQPRVRLGFCVSKKL